MVKRSFSGSPWEPVYGFCRALRVENTIYVAGTAPIPAEGEELAATAYGQMLRCGEIARQALVELGAGLSDVVRTRMFLIDADEADEVGRAHAELFGSTQPVATMVVVAALLDPGWKVELELEAVVSG